MKTLLVPLDFSAQAPNVLEEGIRQAQVDGARIIILVIAEDFSDIGDYAHAAQIQHKLLEEAQQKAEDYRSLAVSRGIEPQLLVLQSPSPADAIISAAEEHNADIIIMGSRAKKGIDRFMLGSVAAKVVSYAPCSVLVVRSK